MKLVKMSSQFVLTALFVAAFTLVARPANAGLLLEPIVGYELGTFKMKADFGSGANDYAGTVNGVNIGGRVGFTLPIFFIAADYSMGTLSEKTTEQPAGLEFPDQNVERSSLFLVAGAKLPLVRFYAGYAFINDWKFKGSTGDLTFKGSAVKFGGSFTGLPIVDINVEYMVSTFSKYSSTAGDFDMSSANTYQSASASSLMFSVSAPFTF